MKTYLVSYDISSPKERGVYEKLRDFITRTYGSWAKPLESLWLIKTTQDIATVRDQMMSQCDNNDHILVIDVTGKGWATFGVSTDVTTWMQNNM